MGIRLGRQSSSREPHARAGEDERERRRHGDHEVETRARKVAGRWRDDDLTFVGGGRNGSRVDARAGRTPEGVPSLGERRGREEKNDEAHDEDGGRLVHGPTVRRAAIARQSDLGGGNPSYLSNLLPKPLLHFHALLSFRKARAKRPETLRSEELMTYQKREETTSMASSRLRRDAADALLRKSCTPR